MNARPDMLTGEQAADRLAMQAGITQRCALLQLSNAAVAGQLKLLSPLSLGPHECPIGDAVRTAVLSRAELDRYLRNPEEPSP